MMSFSIFSNPSFIPVIYTFHVYEQWFISQGLTIYARLATKASGIQRNAACMEYPPPPFDGLSPCKCGLAYIPLLDCRDRVIGTTIYNWQCSPFAQKLRNLVLLTDGRTDRQTLPCPLSLCFAEAMQSINICPGM